MTELKQEIHHKIDALSNEMVAAADYIGKNPELGYQEFLAVAKHKEFLQNHGFTFNSCENIGLPTAYIATYGSGKPVITFMAEYDALPKIGHACGHNISGIASAGAGIAVKNFLEKNKLKGTIQVIGTPAEEGNVPDGGGKVLLLEKNVFDSTDYAISTHAGPIHLLEPIFLARAVLEFNFYGKEAHAAACPENGINALDAALLAINAMNALRQHVTSDVRIHGIISKGGDAINVIPAYAQLQYGVRANNVETLAPVLEKVLNCCRGAALATGCTFEYKHIARMYENMVTNQPLMDIFVKNMEEMGMEKPTFKGGSGSTDVGNVSRVVPTIHPIIGMNNMKLMPHTKEFQEACCSSAGFDSMLLAAKLMAGTAVDLFTENQ